MEPVKGIRHCVTSGGRADTVAIMDKMTKTTKTGRSIATILTFQSNKEYFVSVKKEDLNTFPDSIMVLASSHSLREC